LLNRLRTCCESTEAKAKSYVETELFSNLRTIENTLKELFGAKQSSLRDDINRLEREVQSTTNTEFFLKKPPALVPDSFSQTRITKDESLTIPRNFKSQLSPPPQKPMSPPSQLKDILQRKPQDSIRPSPITRDTPTASTLPNPFTEIERKLAAFDIRNPQRPKTGFTTITRKSDSVEVPPPQSTYKQEHLHERLAGLQPLVSSVIPSGNSSNVDSLRFFRQKMRDHFSRDTTSRRPHLAF